MRLAERRGSVGFVLLLSVILIEESEERLGTVSEKLLRESDMSLCVLLCIHTSTINVSHDKPLW